MGHYPWIAKLGVNKLGESDKKETRGTVTTKSRQKEMLKIDLGKKTAHKVFTSTSTEILPQAA